MSKAEAFKDVISPKIPWKRDQMSEAMAYGFGKTGNYGWEGKDIDKLQEYSHDKNYLAGIGIWKY